MKQSKVGLQLLIKQQVQQLLQQYGVNSLQNFHQILYGKSQCEYVFKIKKNIEKTYSQLFDEYQRGILNQKQFKQYIRSKYYSDQIIRTHQFHLKLWKTSLHSRHLNSHLYFKQLLEVQYPQYYRKIIEADVRRTLQQKSQQNQNKLKRILRGLTIRNPYIGYCQENDIFWIAVQLFQQILPRNYYTNMMGIAIDLKLLEVFLEMRRPHIFQKLKNINVTLSIFCLQWLVCLFTTSLPYYILVIVWDLLFLQGSIILLKTAIIMIEQMQTMIMSCKDITDFLSQLEFYKKNINIQQGRFIQRIKSIYINSKVITQARQIYEVILSQEKPQKKIGKIQCSPKWPICHQLLQKNKIQQRESEVWIFKQDGPPKFITNYFQQKLKKTKIFREDDRQNIKKLFIGRTSHICEQNNNQQKQQIQLNLYDAESHTYQMNFESIINEISKTFQKNMSFLNSSLHKNHS